MMIYKKMKAKIIAKLVKGVAFYMGVVAIVGAFKLIW
jgi:hypothetical protein